MISQLYAIYDSKAKVYNSPFLLMNDAVAHRQAKQMANDSATQCYVNPEDYTLFHIAEYDDEFAQITPVDTQRCIAKFIELKDTTQQD